jgi:succinyl-CoA synthetase alpha subunit
MNFVDVISMFMNDKDTDGIVMIGEIGGRAEIDAAEFIKSTGNKKPVVGFIAGKTAPHGKRMGHAGAIVSGGDDTADAKMEIMRSNGIVVAESPAELGSTIAKALGKV